jgi:4-amino-4-deoxy-L-arabinose transferase-like glycosyltransferase
MIGSESASAVSPRDKRLVTHWLLLLLTLLAFARLVWRWDLRNLWWDESLSLQRAESPLPALIVGTFSFDDGVNIVESTDQHPPLYFALLGGFIRLAGANDLVLRFPSAIAATLLVPMSWAFARLLQRRKLAPPGTAMWAALFAALNPFLLWYGREARMYALIPLLALLSTYCLLRWTSDEPQRRLRLMPLWYAISLGLLLGTHFLSFLILPVHAGLIFVYQYARNRRRALVAAAAVLLGGLAFGLLAASWILRGVGSGTNFSRVPFPMLVADLLNAFSLGLSVNLDQVRWLDFLFAAVALIGAAWALRPRPTVPREAWLMPAFVILPVLELQLIQQFQPAYMNARHMSMISGAFVLLVAAGCAAITRQRWWAGGLVGLILTGGMVYSTVNYFTLPEYQKDRFAQVGADLAAEMLPGDGIVFAPAHMIRLYRHYLPVDALERATVTAAEGEENPHRGWAALPPLYGTLENTEARLRDMMSKHPRVWLVASGMVPLTPLQEETREWFDSNAFLARDLQYPSNTLLWLKLYLPEPPILPALPESVDHRATVAFGNKIRFDGYDIGAPLDERSATPVTLYWQPLEKIERRYKYILRLVSVAEDGSLRTLAQADREPYNGSLPTNWWSPGPEIFELASLPPAAPFDGAPGTLRLALQMYDAETLEKLPVTGAPEGATLADEHTVLMPVSLPPNAPRD